MAILLVASSVIFDKKNATGKLQETTENPQESIAEDPQQAEIRDIHIKNAYVFENSDINGYDIAILKDISFEKCKSACEESGDCKAITYDKWNSYCFIKSGYNSIRFEPKATTVIFSLENPNINQSKREYVIEKYNNRAVVGGEMYNFTSENISNCSNTCELQSTCVAALYKSIDKICRILNSAESIYTDASVVSIIKRQE